MPIYEYQCEQCAKVFEVFQKHSDPPPSGHDCGSKKVHRVLSNTSFRLKGTGWYATDYAKKSSDGGSQASKKDGDAPASKGDAAAGTKGEEGAKTAAAAKGGEASGGRGDPKSGGDAPKPSPKNGGGGAAAA